MRDKRTKEDIDRAYALQDTSTLEVLPVSSKYDYRNINERRMLVAIYARVSTGSQEQYTSYTLQKRTYEKMLADHKYWIMAGMFADEGISATDMKKRDGLNELLNVCFGERRKVDLIITKSVSRFSRNVADCLTIVRRLMRMNPPIGVYFEEERLNTLTDDYEFRLTQYASFSQNESVVRSERMEWSYSKRYGNKQFPCPTESLLGYDKDEYGKMAIEPEGAKTVRLIYALYNSGVSQVQIAHMLTNLGRPTGKGNYLWSSSSVGGIIKNERHCGHIFGQKTFTVDRLTHETRKNIGQRQGYYEANHHPGIVTEDEHLRALILTKANHASPYFNPHYTIQVIRQGLLSGFIPINCAFGGYDAGHYVGAEVAANVPEIAMEIEIAEIDGCQIVRPQEFEHARLAAVTITNKGFTFNTDCVNKMVAMQYVEILLHPTERLLAIRKANPKNDNAVELSPNTVSASLFCKVLFDLMGWRKKWRYKVVADIFCKNKQSVIMFDLNSAEFRFDVYEGDEDSEIYRKIIKQAFPKEWAETFGVDAVTQIMMCRRGLARALPDWKLNAKALPVEGYRENTPDYDINKMIKELEVVADG